MANAQQGFNSAHQNWLDFLQSGNNSIFDLAGQNARSQSQMIPADGSTLDLGRLLRNVGSTANLSLGAATAQTAPLAFGSLLKNIMNQGQTDPALMNRELASIERNTQQDVTDLQGRAAQTGLEGSGMMQALQAAVEASGADRAAGRRAQDSAQAEQLKRQDLDQFGRLILSPALGQGVGGLEAGQASQARSDQQEANYWNTLLTIAALFI